MEQGDEPITDYGYLKALADHSVPLAAVPDGATAKRIREAAGVSRQLAGTVLACGSNTILRYEASQTKHSRLLEGSEPYRALLAALLAYVARTDAATAQEIRRRWKPLEPTSNIPNDNKENAA